MNETQRKRNPKLLSLRVFLKAQASAFIGGLADYMIMVLCTELLGIHYTLSILISGFLGAIVNFSLNRKWTFHAETEILSKQLIRFVIVVGGSVFLKAAGTYLITTKFSLDYKISRILTDLVVSLGFNYTLQRFWVFSKRETKAD